MKNANVLYRYVKDFSKHAIVFEKRINEFYMYCPHCKGVHPADTILRDCEPKSGFYVGYNTVSYYEQCTNIMLDTVRYETSERVYRMLSQRKQYTRDVFLEKFICSGCSHVYGLDEYLRFDAHCNSSAYDSVPFFIEVFRETERPELLKLVTLTMHYSVWNDRFQRTVARTKYVFNTNTGYTYKINSKVISGRKRSPYMDSNSLENVSLYLSNPHTPYEEYNKAMSESVNILYKEVYKDKKALLGHNPDGFKEEHKVSSLNVVAGLNRHPNVSMELFDRYNFRQQGFIESRIEGQKYTKKQYKPHEGYGHLDDNFIGHILKKFKMKSTKSIKRLAQDHDVRYIAWVQDLFKQPNNVVNIVESGVLATDSYYAKDIAMFVKALIAEYGETIAATKLRASRSFIVTDTAQSYRSLMRNDLTEEARIYGSIQEMHDRFASHLKRTKHPLVSYQENYTKEELNMCTFETDTHRFYLAKDNYELIDVGTQMGICVGSYSQQAKIKRCLIMLGVNKKTKAYDVCIELSSTAKSIAQAKAKYNARLKDELYETVINWCKENNIYNTTPYHYHKEELPDILPEDLKLAPQDFEDNKPIFPEGQTAEDNSVMTRIRPLAQVNQVTPVVQATPFDNNNVLELF